MNSDEFVFFSFYRRKHRFSAQIFYLIEENERKNGGNCAENWEILAEILGI